MERFPIELKTPPLSTVLIVGCEELHSQLDAFFSRNLRPPAKVLLHDDSLSFDACFSRKDEGEDIEGLLKLSWVKRMRTQPTIIAAFISRSSVWLRSELDSDPWSVLAKRIDSIKDLCENHYCKLISIIVNNQMEEVPVEVLSAFKNRFLLEDKSVLTLTAIKVDPNDPTMIQMANNELKTIGNVFHENSWQLHQAHLQAILLRSSQRVHSSSTVASWDSFKLGILNEFCLEWTSAVERYLQAYHQLLESLRTRRFQNVFFVECLEVSEVLTMKICTVLMHQKRSEDAWNHFHFHLSKLRSPPESLTVGLKAFFLKWLSRQYLIMLDVVEEKNGDHQTLLTSSIVSNRHLINLYYYSAEAAVQQRRHVAFALTKTSTIAPAQPSATHWGQYVNSPETLDDHLLSLEAEKELQKKSIMLLEKTLNAIRKKGCLRREAHLSLLLAEEHLASGELPTGRELLLKAAKIYRKDGWNHLLSKALRLLIEISQEASWEKIVYSLELATMEDISENEERQKFADSALDLLLANQNESSISEISEAESSVDSTLFIGDLNDLSWGSIFKVLCGFEKPEMSHSERLRFRISVKNNLPVDLPFEQISVHVIEQGLQTRILPLLEITEQKLKSNEWNFFVLEFVPLLYGEIQAKALAFRFPSESSLIWNLPVSNLTPSFDLHEMWKEDQFTPGLHTVHITYVGTPPVLKLKCPKDVYLGEEVFIYIEILSPDECKVEKLMLDVNSPAQKTGIKWKQSKNSALAIPEFQVQSMEPWKEQYELMHIQSPTKVTVRVAMRLNSEFEVTEQAEFDVKEPFKVQSQIYGPALTYLFLPSPEMIHSAGLVTDPLSLQTPPSPSLAVAEGKDSFLLVFIRNEADCAMLIQARDYSVDQESILDFTELSGIQNQQCTMQENDIFKVLLKIKSRIAYESEIALSLKLQWKRVHKGSWKEVSHSKVELIESEEDLKETQSVYNLLKFSVRKPLICASFQPPEKVVPGTPFSYVLKLSNETDLPQELDVKLTESNGCLFCGDRGTQTMMQPKEIAQLQWDCVAYLTGNLKLPKAQISLNRLQCSVEMEGIEIFVKPSVIT